MANYCMNSVTYYGGSTGQILNLYLKLKDAMSGLERGAGEVGARDLLFALGVDEKVVNSIDGRTGIFDFQLILKNNRAVGVEFQAESAWSPCDEFASLLLRAIYPDDENLGFVYIAEEPGMEIYVNTDVNHMFYDTVVNMDIRTDEYDDIFYYGSNEIEEAFDMIESVTGIRPEHLEDLESDSEFMKKAQEKFAKKYKSGDNDYYLGVHLYYDE